MNKKFAAKFIANEAQSEVIKQIRKEIRGLGLTHRDIADRTTFTRQYVSMFLSNHVWPSADFLRALADTLNLSAQLREQLEESFKTNTRLRGLDLVLSQHPDSSEVWIVWPRIPWSSPGFRRIFAENLAREVRYTIFSPSLVELQSFGRALRDIEGSDRCRLVHGPSWLGFAPIQVTDPYGWREVERVTTHRLLPMRNIPLDEHVGDTVVLVLAPAKDLTTEKPTCDTESGRFTLVWPAKT